MMFDVHALRIRDSPKSRWRKMTAPIPKICCSGWIAA